MEQKFQKKQERKLWTKGCVSTHTVILQELRDPVPLSPTGGMYQKLHPTKRWQELQQKNMDGVII